MKQILSTHLYGEYPDWAARVDMLDRRAMSRRRLFRTLVAAGSPYEALILNGSIGMTERYVDLVAAMAVAHRRRPPAIVLTDCSWRLPDRALDRLANRAGIRLLSTPRTRFCVRSTSELELFPKTWGVDPSQVAFTPYGHRLTEDELAAPIVPGVGVFAGGNSLRDYQTLLEAVSKLDAPVTIMTSQLTDRTSGLPDNVRLKKIGSNADFLNEMRSSRIVVTPLAAGIERAAGLDTYLAAMALGKIVVVTESPGVDDYIDDRSTGLVVPAGDSAVLGEALRWALDPAHEHDANELGARAAEAARTQFTYDRYVSRLLDVADAALAGA